MLELSVYKQCKVGSVFHADMLENKLSKKILSITKHSYTVVRTMNN